jgi:Domain of unknown function (DUF4126)
VDLMPMVFATGWASGLNAYATILLLGIIGRVADIGVVPHGLERTDVLIAAALLYAWEFVVDKIPYVDSAWDLVSTALRPTVGAVIGALIAGDQSSLSHLALGSLGGGTALVSHLAKAGIRMGLNASPEPVTNIGASLAEDFSVAGVVSLACYHPLAAAVIAALLLVFALLLGYAFAKRIATGRRRLRRWLERHGLGGSDAPVRT